MSFTITGRNLEITSAIRDYVEKKVAKLNRYLRNIDSVNVVLEVKKYRHKVEMTVNGDSMTLRGNDETNDLYISIDSVVDKIEKQLRRKKDRWGSRRQSGSGASQVIAESIEEEVPGPRVHLQTIQFKPMPLDEAVMEFMGSNQEFFVFVNAKSQRVNVLYRRKDGDLGLIEPA